MSRFKALVLTENNGDTNAAIEELHREDLPPGEVLVQVAYSSLNYKDGLAVTGTGKIVRRFPMVPGIDLSGTVLESETEAFAPGDKVILTGWGVGERHWGGLAQLARLKAKWLVPLPEGLSLKQAMGVGSAGFTAMLCLMALEAHGLTPTAEEEVLVTGASGGVGSFAVALLGQLGYNVVASTGRPHLEDYLKGLGASRLLERSELAAPPGKPLLSTQWAGAIDTVGSQTLATLLASMAYGGSVAACGLAGGSDLPTTVFPFILRGVNLLGIDSVMCPQPRRQQAWERLAQTLDAETLSQITRTAPLSQVPELSHQIIQGQIQGRVIIDVNEDA